MKTLNAGLGWHVIYGLCRLQFNSKNKTTMDCEIYKTGEVIQVNRFTGLRFDTDELPSVTQNRSMSDIFGTTVEDIVKNVYLLNDYESLKDKEEDKDTLYAITVDNEGDTDTIEVPKGVKVVGTPPSFLLNSAKVELAKEIIYDLGKEGEIDG